MQIYVCVKHVPDTAANIKIVGENGFDDASGKFIANPYDEYAVEQAVQIVEKDGGEVVIVTVGKEAATSSIAWGDVDGDGTDDEHRVAQCRLDAPPWPWAPTGVSW